MNFYMGLESAKKVKGLHSWDCSKLFFSYPHNIITELSKYKNKIKRQDKMLKRVNSKKAQKTFVLKEY